MQEKAKDELEEQVEGKKLQISMSGEKMLEIFKDSLVQISTNASVWQIGDLDSLATATGRGNIFCYVGRIIDVFSIGVSNFLVLEKYDNLNSTQYILAEKIIVLGLEFVVCIEPVATLDT